jgi:hypothetical protein
MIVNGWLSYEVGEMRDHIQSRIDNVASRTKVLRESIATNKQALHVIAQSPERPPLERVTAAQAEATALADESRALVQENTAIQSDLAALRHLRDSKESTLFLIVLMLAPVLLVEAVNRIRVQRIQIAERNSSLRASDVDAMLPTARIKQLADQGKKIRAIKEYRQETGAGLAKAKHVVEAYLRGRCAGSPVKLHHGSP